MPLAAGVRAVMTTDGWAQFTATPGQTLADTAPGRDRVVRHPAGAGRVPPTGQRHRGGGAGVRDPHHHRHPTTPVRQGVSGSSGGSTSSGATTGLWRVDVRGGGWLMVLPLAGRGLAARAVGIKAVLLLGGGGTGLLVAGIVLILVLAVGLGDGAQISTTATRRAVVARSAPRPAPGRRSTPETSSPTTSSTTRPR